VHVARSVPALAHAHLGCRGCVRSDHSPRASRQRSQPRQTPTLSPSSRAHLAQSCENVSFAAAATASAHCGAVRVSNHTAQKGGSCAVDHTINVAYGSVARLNYTITVADTTAPPAATANCVAFANPDSPSVTDNCDPHPTVTRPCLGRNANVSCSWTSSVSLVLSRHRVWAAHDAAGGHTASTAQMAMVVDTSAPVATAPRASATLSDEWAPAQHRLRRPLTTAAAMSHHATQRRAPTARVACVPD